MTKYEVLAALFAFDMDVDKTLAVGVHFSEEPDLVLSNCHSQSFGCHQTS